MTEVVLDASVVMKWFLADGERHLEPARSIRAAFEAGERIVFAPRLLQLEIVNVAGRRRRWTEDALLELAGALDDLGFELIEPELARVAYWTARGLTAYDADSVVATDGHAGYNGVAGAGFRHDRHSLYATGDPAHVAMPRVHRVASLLKRWLLGTHQGAVRPRQLDYYRDEFTFRFNRRGSNHRGLLFYRLLEQAVETNPRPLAKTFRGAS